MLGNSPQTDIGLASWQGLSLISVAILSILWCSRKNDDSIYSSMLTCSLQEHFLYEQAFMNLTLTYMKHQRLWSCVSVNIWYSLSMINIQTTDSTGNPRLLMSAERGREGAVVLIFHFICSINIFLHISHSVDQTFQLQKNKDMCVYFSQPFSLI